MELTILKKIEEKLSQGERGALVTVTGATGSTPRKSGTIMGVFKGYAILALIVSMLSLGLPVFDTLFAMGRRAIHHKPIMEADRGHLHHRLHGF